MYKYNLKKDKISWYIVIPKISDQAYWDLEETINKLREHV